MKRKNLLSYRIMTVLLLILFILLYAMHNSIIALMSELPSCPFYTRLHLYCPACGNTRCVKALLHGDILSAVRYNISPMIFGIFIILAYLELVTYSFGRHLRLLPRRLSYYLVVLAILIIYVGVRNFIPGMIP